MLDIVTLDLNFSLSNENKVFVTKTLWERWDLQPNTLYRIAFGNRRFETLLQPIEGNKTEMLLSTKSVIDLLIPFPKQVQAKICGKEIKVGPLIALFTQAKNKTAMKMFNKLVSSPENTSNYTCLFTINDVNWNSNEIVATFRGKNHYYKQKIPIPDVIYNRVLGRKNEASKKIQKAYINFETHKAKIFNPCFFDKMTIHQILIENNRAAQYLPKTFFTPTYSNIAYLIQQYQTAYLKPKNGLAGRGIYSITKHGDQYILNNENSVSMHKSLVEVLEEIKYPQKSKRYLAQQGIRLIEYKGRKLDFRININKNIENQWVITGIAGKVAGKKSVTTHVRLGGKIYSCDEILAATFDEKAPIIKEAIEKAVINIASAIEDSLNGNLGELGIDIGVDKEGKVWMFEANSKPGRSIFKHPSLKADNQHSINLLYEYAYYLSGFRFKR
ncbi:MAG: YheC/YheD family protein [Anaerobacillus sp.]|uniref:YheC/YheD family endospore coat-associated protein n=1 Tax=Anaerobacillus sp. TaxID=1872506 RepID=UPI003919DE7B